MAAIETGTPAPLLTTTLYERFSLPIGCWRPCATGSAATKNSRTETISIK